MSARTDSMGGVILGIIGLLVVGFMYQNVGLVIGDRFVTNDALAINQTENADGYAAQQNTFKAFYDNMTFIDLMMFVAIMAGVIFILRFLGVF